jgi:tetratricopeptide (TPR) repeat protein
MSTHQNAQYLTDLGLTLLGDDQAAQAEVHFQNSLRIDPLQMKALGGLGLALHMQNKHQESEAVYLRMAEMEPSEPMHWMNVGTARRCAGRFDEALYAFARAAQMGAASADFFYNVALAHMARDDFESAYAVLKKALLLNPDDAEIRYRLAFCCYETLRTDEALGVLDGWEEIAALPPEITAHAGELLMKLGQPERAEPAVRSAAAALDADPQARLTLIQVLERTNRTVEARSLLDALLLDPRSAQIGDDLTLMRAQLAHRESNDALAVELLQRVIDGCQQFHNRHFQQFPLAKSLDALGRFDEAFRVLEDAHRSQAAHLKLTAPLATLRGAPVLSITEFSCDPQDVARWNETHAPGVAESPVFIVAFPRSGTTLLELALDAHPALKSMDEQPFLHNALDDLLAEGARYPMALAHLTDAQMDTVRARYWERVRRKLDLSPQQRLIDKNPLNLLRLPVIKRLFPRSKILMCIRHPCDVLLSCYMQHFRAPDFALLCQDLPTLCMGYRRAFDFWYAQQALLRADVLELRYETLVERFEPALREVLQFLELPWSDAVLKPGERAQQKRFISTPSYSQVVQPVSSRSVERWQGYRDHFAPSLPMLQPYFERWNYRGLGVSNSR